MAFTGIGKLIKDLVTGTPADTDYFAFGNTDLKKVSFPNLKKALGIDALNSSLVNVKIKWEYVTDNFMKRIRPYCTSRQSYVIFFQLTGTATEVGKMPLYSAGFLITNGLDRHSITVHAGSVTNHIQGFNNNDTYDESAWKWYRYNTSEIS